MKPSKFAITAPFFAAAALFALAGCETTTAPAPGTMSGKSDVPTTTTGETVPTGTSDTFGSMGQSTNSNKDAATGSATSH